MKASDRTPKQESEKNQENIYSQYRASTGPLAEQARFLAEAMPQKVWTATPDGNVNYMNRHWMDYTGLTFEELKKWGWKKVIHPDDVEENIRVWKESIETGNHFQFEHRFRRFDGKYRWHLTRGTPQFDDKGNVTMWVGTDTDIHDQKLAAEKLEQKIKERTQELQVANEQLKAQVKEREEAELTARQEKEFSETIINNSVDGIVAFDEDFRITAWNRSMEMNYGLRSKDVLGKPVYEMLDYNEERIKELLKKVLSGKTAFIPNKPYRQRSGYYEAYLVPLFDEQKHVKGGLAIIHDITEQKESGEKIIKANKELKKAHEELEKRVEERTAELTAANQELQEFAYIVSHDLKAPLRAIGSLVDFVVMDNEDIQKESKENLMLIKERAGRMDRLIEGILRYSRVGREKAPKEAVDLNLVVPEVTRHINPPENIEIEIESHLPVVFAELTQVFQLFQNLIDNAVKYMDKKRGKIRIGAEEDGDKWKFYIKDNGSGIEQKHFDKIFKIFQTLHPRDHKESTGIGLTIVKKIIDNNDGRIWLESTPGEGTTFYFTLPKDREKTEEEKETEVKPAGMLKEYKINLTQPDANSN